MTHSTSHITTDQSYNPRNAAWLGAAYMIGAGLLFAVVNITVQALTMSYGQASTTVAFWQYFIAMLFSLPWLLSRLRTALKTKRLPMHILRVIFAAAGVQLWVLGLSYVPIWQAIALLMTSPFFVTIGAGLLLGEQITRDRWLAVSTGFIGGMLILAPWSDSFTISALYPLAAAFLWALSSLTTKYLTETESPESLTLYLLILPTPINALLAVQSGFALTSGTAFWLILLAGILTATAHYALAKAYTVADAAYLQPFDHLKLPFNVLLGWLAFGFLPEGSTWLGTALILGASVFLLNRESKI
ncbi:MAG: DMT family transporter [Paracoccaceae bacterium]